jgi:Asp-tRNA(Asn)/Glu-tRNA(Gln) amidotransferase A subunit family amidase
LAGIAPGLTTNPHDVTRTPGGSSSGSAAAVADYMVPLAFGTQTGGSVLRPASYCGIVGYKPTYNSYNREGLKFAAETLDTIGLFGRTVEDCGLFSGALTNQSLKLSAPKRAPRIGICETPIFGLAKPETKKALEEAAQKAKDAGATVRKFKLPAKYARISQSREVINNVERARSLAWEWEHHRDLLSPQMTKSVIEGLATSEAAYHDELQFAEWARLRLDELFADFDILLAPCVHGEAPVGLAFTGEPAFQGFWTILHVPTLALPAARGRNKMPVAVQVIAPRWQDEKLLQAAIWLRDRAGIALPVLKHKKSAE